MRPLTVIYDARDPARLARFWADLLDRESAETPDDETQLGLRFVPGAAPRTVRDRIHLHLTSASLDDQRQRVAKALELGAAHRDVGQRPEEGHIVLADPEGNEFCVIEPGNAFLAGCGLLAEIAGDGTREVGLFWSAALGWPLVWDQDEETAIQAPAGGTKVAWGGPPVAPQAGRNRQRFEVALSGGDLLAEADRLVSLGAKQIGVEADGAVTLTDPDGNEFSLRGN
jgi:predicted enzyme related to lactoylglutathione lyase